MKPWNSLDAWKSLDAWNSLDASNSLDAWNSLDSLPDKIINSESVTSIKRNLKQY